MSNITMKIKTKNKVVKSLSTFLAIITVMSTANFSNAQDITLKSENTYSNFLSIAKKATGKNLIVASNKSYPDSLSAINMTFERNDKLMLVDDSINIKDMINQLRPEKVIKIGGPSTVSKSIENKLKKEISNVSRTYGRDRYQTNKATLNSYDNTIAVSGTNFADAISASNLVKSEKLPILLVKKYESAPNYAIRFTVGGKDSVHNTFGRRLAGGNRYQTNEQVLKYIGNTRNTVIANASNFMLPLMSTNIIFNSNSDSLLKLTSSTSKTEEVKSESGLNNIINNNSKPVIKPDDKSDNKHIEIPVEREKEKTVESIKVNLQKDSALGINYAIINNEKVYIIDTENDLNRLIKIGMIDNENINYNVAIVPELTASWEQNIKLPIPIKTYLTSLGFTVHGKRYDTKNINSKSYILMKATLGYHYYEFGKEVDLSELRAGRAGIADIIAKSGANSMSSDKDKADAVALYLMKNYPAFEYWGKNDKRRERHPFTIVEYGTGVCEGYTLAFSEAMRQLHIPNYGVITDNFDHIVCVTKTEEGWLTYNVTPAFGGYETNKSITAEDLRIDKYSGSDSPERNEMTMDIFNLR